jgi:shikimate kinase
MQVCIPSEHVEQKRACKSFTMPSMQNLSSSLRKFQSGNLILIGMMGSGKTTMGRALAKHLNKTFIDSDEEIQLRTGVTIPHIFDVEGEVGFRVREAQVIADLMQRDNMLLATGGGAILTEQTQSLLPQNGVVIYLRTQVHDLWQRTRNDKNRPLLQTGNPYLKLTQLFEQRDPIYRQVADLIIPSGKQSVHSMMLSLISEVEKFKCKHEGWE